MTSPLQTRKSPSPTGLTTESIDHTLHFLEDPIVIQGLMEQWLGREDADEEILAKSLVDHFDARNRLLEFLSLAIQLELHSSRPQVLWREDSLCSRMIVEQIRSVVNYESSNPYSFLDSVLGEKLAKLQNKGCPGSVEALAESVLESLAIFTTYEGVPRRLKSLHHVLYKCSEHVHPDTGYQSLGSFFFLRFISPYLIFKTTSSNFPELLKVAKLLQSLASCDSESASTPELQQFQRRNRDLLFSVYQGLIQTHNKVRWKTCPPPASLSFRTSASSFLRASENRGLSFVSSTHSPEVLKTFLPISSFFQLRFFVMKRKLRRLAASAFFPPSSSCTSSPVISRHSYVDSPPVSPSSSPLMTTSSYSHTSYLLDNSPTKRGEVEKVQRRYDEILSDFLNLGKYIEKKSLSQSLTYQGSSGSSPSVSRAVNSSTTKIVSSRSLDPPPPLPLLGNLSSLRGSLPDLTKLTGGGVTAGGTRRGEGTCLTISDLSVDELHWWLTENYTCSPHSLISLGPSSSPSTLLISYASTQAGFFLQSHDSSCSSDSSSPRSRSNSFSFNSSSFTDGYPAILPTTEEIRLSSSVVDALRSHNFDGKRFVQECSDHTALLRAGITALRERKHVIRIARAAITFASLPS